MIPVPLLLRYRRQIVYVLATLAAAGAVWAAIDNYGDRRASEAESALQARWDADEAEATKGHNDRIAKLNEAHHEKESDLETRLTDALNKPPAVRIVRVQDTPACPAPVTLDAGQPAPVDPEGGSIGEGEADYRVLRDEILRLGADAEKFRQMALDARDGWPR